MILENDDALKEANTELLGVPGYKFPWRARFIAYGLGALILVGLLGLELFMHLPMGFFTLLWTAMIGVPLTYWIASGITPNRTARSWFGDLWDEITAPRPDKRVDRASFAPASVPTDRPRPSQYPALLLAWLVSP